MFNTSSGDDRLSRSTDSLALEVTHQPSGAKNSAGFSAPSPVAPKLGGLQKNWALLRKLYRATFSARQQGYLLPETFKQEVPSEELEALRQAALQGEIQKARSKRHQDTAESEQFSGHAQPISPLRERDINALSDLFQRADMFEVEADINSRLLQLLPEPCWEDDPFDFVREFL